MISRPITKFLAPVGRAAMHRRSYTVVSSPPTEKVSSAEKIILGGGVCVCTLAIPAWVLYHIREYRGLK